MGERTLGPYEGYVISDDGRRQTCVYWGQHESIAASLVTSALREAGPGHHGVVLRDGAAIGRMRGSARLRLIEKQA